MNDWLVTMRSARRQA
ncbi:hypothetical protein E2C01_060582 [Portunus trituberculatus]|uniref:Uncharacterized protein n=1 Tax=Portunus trituberculatus TaxID=210409 RepID=A0A5B7H9V2_PORTR|nr:hypothetical protein [Portunus trituberculatus]